MILALLGATDGLGRRSCGAMRLIFVYPHSIYFPIDFLSEFHADLCHLEIFIYYIFFFRKMLVCQSQIPICYDRQTKATPFNLWRFYEKIECSVVCRAAAVAADDDDDDSAA